MESSVDREDNDNYGLRGNEQATTASVVIRGRSGHSSVEVLQGLEDQRYRDVKRSGRALIDYYTGKLTKRGLRKNERILLKLCQKFEQYAGETLTSMVHDLRLTGHLDDGKNAFLNTMHKMFRSGTTMARVVCFFTFSACLARHCSLRRDRYMLVDRIVEWHCLFIDDTVGQYLAGIGDASEEGAMVSWCVMQFFCSPFWFACPFFCQTSCRVLCLGARHSVGRVMATLASSVAGWLRWTRQLLLGKHLDVIPNMRKSGEPKCVGGGVSY